ncbi:ABC transporter substrate-binding protein [Rubrivirga sp.]|uniref:ABC transporter substrate-binding protein n=1 Tax=Rubrivirga sp. TaxID=1885344 RepID=UPI003B526E95
MRARLLVSALALLVALPGCGGAEADDGRTTVVFWHSLVNSSIPAFEDLVERFEAEHPDIRIDAQYIPSGDALVQKLITSVRSNTAPDVSWIRADYLEDLVRADAIYPMADFINGPDGLPDSTLEDVYPSLLQLASWRGDLYSLPMEATNLGLLYNKDLFREVGLDPERPPQTWDELLEYSRRLTLDEDGDGRNERIGFLAPVYPADSPLGPWMVWQWTPFLWQAGGSLITEDQTRVLFGDEAGVQALTLWKELYEGQNQKTFSNEFMTTFASQQAAMMLDGPWSLPNYPRLLANMDWGVAPLPAGPDGRATIGGGEYLAIFKQSEHPDAAWTFIKWMMEPEVQAQWSRESGYLPIRRSVLDVPSYRAFLEENDGLRAFVEQMSVSGNERIDYQQLEISRLIAQAIERATVGGEDPRAALEAAAAESNRLLDAAERVPDEPVAARR